MPRYRQTSGDRQIYPVHLYSDGQWDYYLYYATNFAGAVADLEAQLASTLRWVRVDCPVQFNAGTAK